MMYTYFVFVADESNQAKESEEKLRSELVEISRRHKVLLMRLTTRERQLVETEAQISELKKSVTPSAGALRSTLLDPAVNLIITKMKGELEETKKKLENTQNDLNAWKFTPDR
jgi:predicted  nucleic acid-binding Zn-ribbon protein